MNLAEKSRAVLDENWRGGYTIPSARLYPFQWNWDSGFIALGLACHRPERAIEEIRHMFLGLWSNGLLPHIVFHKPDPNYFPGPDAWGTQNAAAAPRDVRTSGITQPPVFAFVVERIAQLPLGRTPEWQAFEREIYPKILAFHRYLYTCRDPEQEGLVYIQHNWEAGTDNSPTWDAILEAIDVTGMRDVSPLRRDIAAVDAAHRPTNANYQRYIHLVDLFSRCGYEDARIRAECPFLVQDVLFNSLLIRSNSALVSLARRIGQPSAEIEAWNERAIASMNRKLWDPTRGFYYPYDLRAKRLIRIKTNSGFMPLFAGVCDEKQAARLAHHLEHSFAQGPDWRLCASTAADESSFQPIKYWRGPVWVNTNWLLWHGLRRYGLERQAERVKKDTFACLEEFGLYEYFDPRPGAAGRARHGLGADRFSWSAALALDWLENPRPL
jgi:glycogen debranching enzyme